MLGDKKDDRILVIEDNPGDFALVEDFLSEKMHFPVITHCETYENARVMLSDRKNAFDVVLLDLTLPDKTGEELIKSIVEVAADVPVIVLTGYTDLNFGIRSLSWGIIDYILKDELTSLSLYKSIIYSLERKRSLISLSAHIKAIEEQNQKMREISWMQSHVIRAPLARMMGLMYLIKANTDEMEQVVDYLFQSANELDDVIKSITAISKTSIGK
ncbi:response regulator [Mucilaginibacter sp. HMF5004]|uniref:response regulator n=1 Tax=Mucilaginibacter rivuli TaxID=2857527 RepID=UPI001C5DA8BD|nr:response regulator [Mucilaginibacter rivuli]MBW4891739.1 response regulator [Mucilaginibacter rivuli]